VRLNLELCAQNGSIQCILHLFPLDEDTLDPTHGIEQIFNQKGFLDLNREAA
jgi:hypothetical protein